jgi:hypothetical protein
MALESAPLTWLKILKPESIDSWEDLMKVFIDNFQGSMLWASTHHDLSQVKQEENETLRSYTRRFFEDVIHSFQNGLDLKHIYCDFGCNCPTSTVELQDMMQ